MRHTTIAGLLIEYGKLPSYTGLGGYPFRYYSADGGSYCPDCANQADAEPEITDWDVVYEGPADWCAGCGKELETAYGDPDAE